MKEIDARRQACPAPVLMTKTAIEEKDPSIIKVTVDNEAAKQNVSRFLQSRQFEISEVFEGNDSLVLSAKRKMLSLLKSL